MNLFERKTRDWRGFFVADSSCQSSNLFNADLQAIYSF